MATASPHKDVTEVPLLEVFKQQATEDEQNSYTQARLQYLESRVVALNVEVRVRDNEINQLKVELSKYEDSVEPSDTAEAV